GQDASCVAQPPAPVSLQPIVEAWKARQQRVKSARFRWQEERLEAKGWIKGLGGANSITPGKEAVPSQDLTYKVAATVSFDNDRWNFTVCRGEGSFGNAPRAKTSISVFDGKTVKAFQEYQPPGDRMEQPIGSFREAKRPPNRTDNAVKPLLWTYRIP